MSLVAESARTVKNYGSDNIDSTLPRYYSVSQFDPQMISSTSRTRQFNTSTKPPNTDKMQTNISLTSVFENMPGSCKAKADLGPVSLPSAFSVNLRRHTKQSDRAHPVPNIRNLGRLN
jgi:hypothetical protein